MRGSAPPDAPTLDQFGASRGCERLRGGQGLAWRAGDRVLKRVDNIALAEWLGETMSGIEAPPTLRLAVPVRSRGGTFVVNHWCAWQWLDGDVRPGHHLRQVFAVAHALHTVLAGVRWSPLLNAGDDRWGHADRMAFGEAPIADVAEPLRPVIETLIGHRRTLDEASQLIHADLAGNIVWADGMAPGVIDITPYWRPAGLPTATLVHDLIVWHGAGPELLTELHGYASPFQLLVHATLGRALTDDLLARADPVLASDLPERSERYQGFVQLIVERHA
jgi:uncharacterized protein (TIGR02569 family)